MSHKPKVVSAGTLALLAFSGLTACASMTQRTSSPRTYAAHGVSFRYPRAWSQGRPGHWVGCCHRNELWAAAIGPSGGDAVDSVVVTASRLVLVVTRQNFLSRAFMPGEVSTTRGQFRQVHGELIAGPHAITVGGMPGLRFAGTAKLHATAAKVTLVNAFDGRTEYDITCSSTPAKARAVQQACTQVIRTFKVSNLFKAGAAINYRAHGVSFDYPTSWIEGGVPGVPAGCNGCKSWATSVALDRLNAIDVIATGHQPRVTRKNLAQAKPYVTRAERHRFGQSGGRLLTGPEAITVGGMLGLLYRGTETFYGTAVKATVAVVFRGPTIYEISCTFTPSKAGGVNRACAEVLRTFQGARQ